MRVTIAAASLTLALIPAPAAAQPTDAPDYRQPSNWICLPGRNDTCSSGLSIAELTAKGYAPTTVTRVAKDPAIDCFYIYPTISRDRGMNSDLSPSKSEELFVVQYQFTRLSSVCRPFVPAYRQMTVSAVAVASTGGDVTSFGEIAYGDVRAAWNDYLANRNEGRPFVLIGHSQGSVMLEQLIRREIEGKPIAKQMLRAYLPGWNILVPPGQLKGGSFQSVPLCASASDTGCIVAWASYGEGEVPPANALFGYSANPALTVGCVNPSKPGSRDWEPLDGFWYANSSYPVRGGPIRWSGTSAPPTPYITTPGLAEGRCVNDGPRGYLEVRLRRGPGDTRTDRVPGEVGAMGIFLAGWGKHMADISLVQGDLIDAVSALGNNAAVQGAAP